MPPKTRKSTSLWQQCESCFTNILLKDVEPHSTDCPPNVTNPKYNFVSRGTLYGTLDIKTSEDIKAVSQHDKDNMVFLSQSVIQLCSLSIGEWAEVRCLDSGLSPVARTVWPTVEKSVTSVLFTKNGVDLFSFAKTDLNVQVSKLVRPHKEARLVTLVILNGPRNMELSPELQLRLHKSHLDRLLTQSNRISILYYGKLLKFEIKSVDALNDSREDNVSLVKEFSELSIGEPEFYKVTEKTNWKLYRNELEYKEEVASINLFEKIGGLDEEILEINDLLNAALNYSKRLFNFKVGKGVLLYGNSGTGKTLLANAIVKSSKANIVNMCAADLYTKYSGSTEETVKKLFEDAIEHAPSVILMDEVDMLCPSRSSRMTDVEKRIASCVLTFFDDLSRSDDCKIFVLGTTNKLESVDLVFRRCGRFDREIEIPTPNPSSRFDILHKLLVNVPNNLEVDVLKEIANSAHGFVGSDLVSLCSRAGLHASKLSKSEVEYEDFKFALTRVRPSAMREVQVEVDVLKEIANSAHGFVGSDLVSLCSRAGLHASKLSKSKVEYEDFKFALTRVRPSAMREVQVEVPNVKWSDIGGQESLKLILRQSVEWPLKHADSFTRMGITPPRGVLMYGPPGCSKTMIAKALATESGLNFLSIKGPELFSKWVGESERAVREVFRKARQVAPSIIFFDEIDALGGERSSGSSANVQERVLAQLLTELDGVTPLGDVTILAATNRPDRIDRALLRPGRLDRIVYVPLPDDGTRMEIFQLKMSKMPVVDVNIDQLIVSTEGYSGAEIIAVCHEAAMAALEESLDANGIEMRHFERALHLIQPRTDQNLMKIYECYTKK